MKKLGAGILFFLISIFVQAIAQTTTPRGLTPEDYFAFEFLSDPHIAPDGKQIAYVVTKVDRAQNRRNSAIWMAKTEGGHAPWQFPTGLQSASAPRWSPDGNTLAFLSSRPAADVGTQTEPPRPQVYLLSLNGGEAQRVTNLKNGVNSFQWSPDGTRLAILSRIGPSDNRPENKNRSDVRHYKDIRYKFNDTGWFDARRSHLWVVEVKTGVAKQLTEGDDWRSEERRV